MTSGRKWKTHWSIKRPSETLGYKGIYLMWYYIKYDSEYLKKYLTWTILNSLLNRLKTQNMVITSTGGSTPFIITHGDGVFDMILKQISNITKSHQPSPEAGPHAIPRTTFNIFPLPLTQTASMICCCLHSTVFASLKKNDPLCEIRVFFPITKFYKVCPVDWLVCGCS